MTPSYQRIKNQHFLYDSSILKEITPAHFEPAAWRKAGKVTHEAQGRGNTLFISESPHNFVLRHYKRGGIVSKLITDHYFWQGLSRTRAWREWDLLQLMIEETLPVPQAVAARVVKSGCVYTADLLMIALPECQSLAEKLKEKTLTDDILYKAGETIRRFHDHQIYHADLNAHNILINTENRIYLIDFDQGRQQRGETWKAANLARLERSLSKVARAAGGMDFPTTKWQHLLKGYTKK